MPAVASLLPSSTTITSKSLQTLLRKSNAFSTELFIIFSSLKAGIISDIVAPHLP